jgi:beta-glucosidase/6-phospho-beta-glucosidase/beta-galactosidase
MFDNLLARGMTPNVTLHHFTAPQWFMDIGGWTKAENIQLFVEYAVKVGQLGWDAPIAVQHSTAQSSTIRTLQSSVTHYCAAQHRTDKTVTVPVTMYIQFSAVSCTEAESYS